jgi:hypothetical protein
VLYHPSTIFTFNVKFSTKIHEKIRWVRKTEKETETEEEGRERMNNKTQDTQMCFQKQTIKCKGISNATFHGRKGIYKIRTSHLCKRNTESIN